MPSMELAREQVDAAKPHLSNRLGSYAPLEVFTAMLHLQDPSGLVASACESQLQDNETSWRSLWLAEGRLTYCSAKAATPNWNLSTHGPIGTFGIEIDAWTVSLRNVDSVSITAARTSLELNTWMGDMAATVRVRGKNDVTLPLFGGFPGSRQQEQCEQLLRELAERLS